MIIIKQSLNYYGKGGRLGWWGQTIVPKNTIKALAHLIYYILFERLTYFFLGNFLELSCGVWQVARSKGSKQLRVSHKW